MKHFHNFKKYVSSFLCCFSLLIGISTPALSEEIYVFERMWPTLAQPWYFNSPRGITMDHNGYIYVVDRMNLRVQKFTSDGQFVTNWTSRISEDDSLYPYDVAVDESGFVYVTISSVFVRKFASDGQFITQWGSYGSGNGEFNSIGDIAVDGNGNVYVADRANYRIQKFTSNGQFITKWGTEGTGDGEFGYSINITLDKNGCVFVADSSWNSTSSNHRIQKFTSDGQFITKWGTEGTGDGEFGCSLRVSVGEDGFVYVADEENYRVQVFKPLNDDSNGYEFVTKWGTEGTGDEEFSDYVTDILAGRNGFVYVVDNGSIKKFTSTGQLMSIWVSKGSGDNKLNYPSGIAVDEEGFVYIADYSNDRIKKYTANGQFVTKWGTEGTGDGEFDSPYNIEVDSTNFVFVVDHENHRIQKFTSDGQFVTKWGTEGTGDGEFDFPRDIAIDINGSVYVADTGNARIQKFKPKEDGSGEYEFVLEWGTLGSQDGEFGDYVSGIAVDLNGFVYVADSGWNLTPSGADRIQIFTPDGQFITKWGTGGTGDGEFRVPFGLAVDEDAFVYVSDNNNHRIQKFTSDGQFVTKCGCFGSEPGNLIFPAGLAVDSAGKIYVCDRDNDRIQVYNKITQYSSSKAIIVAGGGYYAGNNLWEATQMSANFAYRALTYQGFTKGTIYYLTANANLDLDNNGETDDVDGDATNANLQHAITTWAADADKLVLYLVDHGGDGNFRMSGTETLSASDLDSWLDQFQDTVSGKVIIIYDACESGSFLSSLTPPSEKERSMVTSTSPGESAYFVTQGSVSFSNYFWTHIFNGLDIKNSFSLASEAIGQTTDYQHPLLDADGDGTGNETEDLTLAEGAYIGNGTVISGEIPEIGYVSDPQTINGTSSATLSGFDVTDDDGIARVWAVIRPPDYSQGSPDNPVQNLPSIDLMPVGEDQYEGIYDGFNIEGTYSIAIYARDRTGNTSVPLLTTVNVNNPLRRRAIIVAGGSQSDQIWPAIENNATLVYEALTFQGYTDDDIYFMSPVTFSAGVDGTATFSNLEYAINTWAQESTQDLVLYMIGNGGDGTFELNESETLSVSQLDSWLDTLQGSISGKVTIIYEACQSGSFLPLLIPPEDKERILISSTSNDQTTYFLSEGDISFSRFFWRHILNGMNVRDAYVNAKNAIYYCAGQTPQLDDNSNGIGNEKQDGLLSREYSIGVGIMLAGDDPIIGPISSDQTLSGISSATIWADDVTTTGSIERVWAVITPPDYEPGDPYDPVTDLPTLDLIFVGGNKYAGTYTDFTNSGTYKIYVYAMDADGNISIPMETRVLVEVSFPWELFYPAFMGKK